MVGFVLLTGGDRTIGEAVLLGETLTHTSYEPTSNSCEGGRYRLYTRCKLVIIQTPLL